LKGTLAQLIVGFALVSPIASEVLAQSAPYPPSQVVLGVTYDWSTRVRRAAGSDNWPITWADDDHQYSSWGDGNGFNPGDTRVSLGFARIEGDWNDYQGYDVWGGDTAEHPAQFDGKSYGVLCVDGVLYKWVGPGSGPESYAEARLYRSTNRGGTWTGASWAIREADGIVMPTILNFGKNYAGARDTYVYHYFIDLQYASDLGIQRPGLIYLARCPKNQLFTQSAYEWYTSTNPASPSWGPISAKQPVFTDAAGGVGWNLSVSHNGPLGRYFLITEHGSSSNGRMGMFDAPEPWGPWTTVAYTSSFQGGDTFFYNFANKWLSPDGLDFTLVYTGIGTEDAWHTVRGRFTIASDPDETPPSVPPGLEVSGATETTLDLSWDASTDDEGSTPISYQIENVTSGDTSSWQATRTLTVTGLDPSTWYTFRAKARDAAGNESAWSDTTGGSTAAANRPPNDPTDVGASATGATSILITWTSGGDPDGDPVQFMVREVDDPGIASGWLPAGTTSWSAQGLSPETTYQFEVQARDDATPAGLSGWVQSNPETTGPDANDPPNDPTSVVATSLGQTSVRISWVNGGDPDGDPVEFQVREVTDASIQSGWLGAGTTQWTATGLDPATTYRFEVQGRDDGSPPGFTSWVASNPVTTDSPPNEPPNRPTNVVATALGPTSVEIQWTDNGDPDGDPVEYYVEEVYDVEIASGWLATGATSWIATNLAPGTTYRFQVRGRDDANPPAYSAWVRANLVTTGDVAPNPPYDPSNVIATTLGPNSIEITWVDNGHPDDLPVQFYVEETSDPTIQSGWLATSVTSWTAESLAPGTTYQFAVRARDDQDPRQYSAWVSSNPATTAPDANDPPNDPLNVVASALGTSSIEITWTHAGDPDGDPVQYFVREVNDHSIASGWLASGSTRWTATGLEPATAYRFEVQGRDDQNPAGYTAWVASNEAQTSEPSNHPPNRPENVLATADGMDTVHITWTSTGDPDGDAVQYYVEEVYDTSITSGWLAEGVSSWTATGLAPGTTYKFQVRSRDDHTPPAYSAWVRANTVVTDGEAPNPPHDPSGVTASATGPFTIRVSWIDNGHPDGRPVEFYVEEINDPTIQSGWLPIGTTVWTAGGLAPETTYTFAVRGRDDQNPPQYSAIVLSNPASTGAPPNEPPRDPSNVAASAQGATRVRIAWTDNGDPEGQPVEFFVREIGDPSIVSGWLSPGVVAWTATGLDPETTYTFEVQGRDNGEPRGFSAWVASNTVVTPSAPNEAPNTPPSVSATPRGSRSIEVTWENAGDPDGDPVQYFVREVGNPSRSSGWLPAGVTAWTAADLTPLTAYRFEVQGRDDATPPLTTPWVMSNIATTGDVPNQPPANVTDVEAAGLNATSIRVTWNASVDPEGDLVEYIVRATADTTITSGWRSSGALEWIASSLAPQTTYTFEVRSRDDGTPPLASQWVPSNPATTFPPVLPPPTEPVSAFEEDRIVLEWPESEDTRVVGYHVYRLREGGSPVRLTLAPVPDTRFEDDAFEEGSGYFYWVTAVDSEEQESPPSDEVWIRATPNIPPRAFVEKAFPSPIRDQVTFRLGIPETGPGRGGAVVSVDLYDLAGKKIGRVLEETLAPGMRELTWRMPRNEAKLVPGFYLAVVRAGREKLIERIAYAGLSND